MILDIKQLLKRARQAGMTDPQICLAAKINTTTLWRWENGKFNPRLGALVRLQKVIARRMEAKAK